MNSARDILIPVLLASLLAGCSDAPGVQQKYTQDMDSLEIKLKEAIRQKISVCGMNDFTGIPPIINTCSEQDRLALLHANIAADSDRQSPDFPKLSEAGNVVYWRVSDEPDYTRIKGIYWDGAGQAHIFSGRVYPP